MTIFAIFLTLAVISYLYFRNRKAENTLNDMFKPIPVPESVGFNSTPTEVLTFAKDKGHLNVNTEFLREYILRHTPFNPDDEDPYNSCILGDLEIYCDVAEDKQEQFENEIESAVNNTDHPLHQKALAYYTSESVKQERLEAKLREKWKREGRI